MVLPMAVLLLCALTLSSCAKEKPVITWEQEREDTTASIEAIKVTQEEVDAAVQANAVKLTELDALKVSKRLKDLEKVNRTQQAQIDALTARIEKFHRKRRVTPRPVVKSTPTAKQGEPSMHRTTPVKAPVAPPANSKSELYTDRGAQAEAEKNAYTAAYLALKSGRFDEASRAFNEQLDVFPDGEYADQAWFWLGETRISQQALENALHAFKYVADHYPDSVKHAAALLKLGQLSEMSNSKKAATGYYSRLIKEHPESALAEQAQAALVDIRKAESAAEKKQGENSLEKKGDSSPEKKQGENAPVEKPQ